MLNRLSVHYTFMLLQYVNYACNSKNRFSIDTVKINLNFMLKLNVSRKTWMKNEYYQPKFYFVLDNTFSMILIWLSIYEKKGIFLICHKLWKLWVSRPTTCKEKKPFVKTWFRLSFSNFWKIGRSNFWMEL